MVKVVLLSSFLDRKVRLWGKLLDQGYLQV
jgi:hypothetical protein